MANEYYISAGLVPIDNSSGATINSFYISAGLVPDDTAEAPTTEDNRIVIRLYNQYRRKRA